MEWIGFLAQAVGVVMAFVYLLVRTAFGGLVVHFLWMWFIGPALGLPDLPFGLSVGLYVTLLLVRGVQIDEAVLTDIRVVEIDETDGTVDVAAHNQGVALGVLYAYARPMMSELLVGILGFIVWVLL